MTEDLPSPEASAPSPEAPVTVKRAWMWLGVQHR